MNHYFTGNAVVLQVRFYDRFGVAYTPSPVPTVRVLRIGDDQTTVELAAAGTACTQDVYDPSVFEYTVSAGNNDRPGLLDALFTSTDTALNYAIDLYNRRCTVQTITQVVTSTYIQSAVAAALAAYTATKVSDLPAAAPNSAAIQAAASAALTAYTAAKVSDLPGAAPNTTAIQAAAAAALTAYTAAKVSDLPAAAPNSAAVQAAVAAALTAYDAATGSDVTSASGSQWDLSQTGNQDPGTMGALIGLIYSRIQRGTIVVSGEQNQIGNVGTLTPNVKTWYAGATWKFDVKVTVNGAEQDIRGDSVKISLTPQDGGTAISATATIDTGTANGIAHFSFSTVTTALIDSQPYFVEVVWTHGSDQNVILRQNWEVLKRLTP